MNRKQVANQVQDGRRRKAREKRRAAGQEWRNPPDDGEGAFPPIAEDTPGQDESRVAFERFNLGRSKCPWWLEYLDLRAEGWDWRRAALIAWMASPAGRRWPKNQAELAQKALGLASDRVLRKWREDDPAIDERIARLQVEPLFIHRRDVINALVKVASRADHLAHGDRELFLKMTGDYKPLAGKIDLGGEGDDGFGDVGDDELDAIKEALRGKVKGSGAAQHGDLLRGVETGSVAGAAPVRHGGAGG